MDAQTMQKLQQLLGGQSGGGGNLQSLGLGGNMSPQPPQAPGRVGAPPPQMIQPPKINFSTAGAGAQMPAPAPPPPPTNMGMQSDPGLMSKLDPKGASVYSAIQGVSQMLGQWQQKKEQKSQAEAANIAQNLMKAVESGDKDEVAAILNDPKSTKVLNKVYKGWLTPAPQEKPQDPEVQAFTQGIVKYMESTGPKIGSAGTATSGGGYPITNAGGPPMTQGQQPQPQQQPQQQQQGGMPRQMGGYMLPQSLPPDLMKAATQNAELQRAKQDPGSLLGNNQLSSEQIKQAQMYAAQLDVSPKELAMLDASQQRELIKAYAKVATMEMQQKSMTDRALGVAQVGATSREKVAGISSASRKEVAKITGTFKIAAADIVAKAAKDRAAGKNNPDEISRKILDAQLKSMTAMKDNANTQYEQAMKNDNPTAATQFKQQMDSLDSQIGNINQQMDDLKAVGDMSKFNDIIKFLASDEAEPDPDASESDDK